MDTLGSEVANHADRKRERQNKMETRYYSTWVFRLIVSNATAGGTASMDVNLDPTATAEPEKKGTIDGQSSRAIMNLILAARNSCRSRKE
jgi:hypothetical protein